MRKTAQKAKDEKILYDARGKKVGVLVSRKKYEKLLDLVDDYHDCKTVIKLGKQRGHQKIYSSEEIRKMLGN